MSPLFPRSRPIIPRQAYWIGVKLLRAHLVWRMPSETDDARVCTFDYEIIPESWPSDAPFTYQALETKFDTWWNAIKTACTSHIRLEEIRWYREDDGSLPWGEPARIVARSSYGGTGNEQYACPPQVACSVTEVVEQRRHWGRFYIPGISTSALGPTGRLAGFYRTAIANATQTLYNTVQASGVHPVVLSGGNPPYTPQARDVTEIRVDDVLDVQRPRRYRQAIARSILPVDPPGGGA